MSDVQPSSLSDVLGDRDAIVNDFQLMFATVNGSGSQTANTVLLRAIFRMGVPVSGKNIFPSNIQGLPTWYTIRVSKDGYIARTDDYHVLVAMNRETIQDDIAKLASGGVCFCPAEWKIAEERNDIVYYHMPVRQLVNAAGVPQKLKTYVQNMVYVGVVAAMLEISLDEIEFALDYHFNGREKPVRMNLDMVQAAYDWAQDNLAKADPFRVAPMDKTQGMILFDGNSAAALGTVFGGVSFCAWYPITPSTSTIDALRAYLSDFRTDPKTGKATYAVIQAEDELAAIGMVIGAGWAGARAMTATSGPGLSLMSEFAGMAYYAEIPAVIWDVQRVGPSTGLPTRTAQGDVLMAYYLGHGDTRHVLLFPNGVAEAFEFGWRALDLADRLQTLVIVLSDLDLGMNIWMSERFQYPDQPIDRGKILSAEELDQIEDYGRYKDVDGDGIPWRTLPGNPNPKGAWFARGTGHDEHAIYSERPDVWEANMARLHRKFDTARHLVPPPVVDQNDQAEIGLIAYGTTDPCIIEGRDMLAAQGVPTSYLRLRALPVNEAVRDFIAAHDRVYVVENNHDGQMAMILRAEYPELAGKIRSLAHLDGLPLSARWMTETLLEMEQE